MPDADDGRPHGLKYSLFYGRDGERIIGCNNERRTGDHWHYRDRKEPYTLTTAGQMVADFIDDVEGERSRK
ncbi:toxin-antitoxin system TumE family protein [Paraburkholderia aspalathi]|uniref:toxin-antitoxin system TumE family protein n=1 Tax=Paraburkholderia aspalathi TaxID=1324617 RepID=UPI0038B8F4D6